MRPSESPGLARALGLWDVTAITAGTILGSAIFVAAAFVPRQVPHPTLALLLWVFGGAVAIAGALSYAELGAMFPASRRAVSLSQTGVWLTLGVSLWLDDAADHPIRGQCISRRRVRQLPRCVFPVLLVRAHRRNDRARAMDLAAKHRAAGGSVGNRDSVGRQLFRCQARNGDSRIPHRGQASLGGVSHWLRTDRFCQCVRRLGRCAAPRKPSPCDWAGARGGSRRVRRVVSSDVLRRRD